MDETSNMGKMDEIMLPGFRFHPTDEELVGFYLKKKVQQKALSIELIRQLDIYKFDPWDLPTLATTTGEKEWYFYCPRDRKYRNSTRPNRVTGAGFWKATGTDRPIYSSEGTKCIGLKKSLVFYRGRAARGTKTDWMMHEFRLPSPDDPSPLPKRTLEKNIHPNDSWAICKIFKKTNSMAQRAALCQSWASPPLPETNNSDMVSALPQAQLGYSLLDLTSNKPLPLPASILEVPANSMLNFSPPVAGDVEAASTSIGFGQMGAVMDNLGSEEESGIGSTFYVRNEKLGSSEVVDFPFHLPWNSVACPSEMSMSWNMNKCYNCLDEDRE